MRKSTLDLLLFLKLWNFINEKGECYVLLLQIEECFYLIF